MILSAPGESTTEFCLLNISDAFDYIALNTCEGKPKSLRTTDTGILFSLWLLSALHDGVEDPFDAEGEVTLSKKGSGMYVT